MNYWKVYFTFRGQDTYCSSTLKQKTSAETKQAVFTCVVASARNDAFWGNLQVALTSVGSFADLNITDGADDKL